MNDKLKTFLLVLAAMLSNTVAWFAENSETIAQILAAAASLAVIFLSILHALRLRQGYLLDRERRDRERDRNYPDIQPKP